MHPDAICRKVGQQLGSGGPIFFSLCLTPANPHFHVMCPIRPMEPDGRWGNKQRREYVLDEHGERVLDEAGNYAFNAVPTTDWGKPETLEAWRQAWADLCNAKFVEKGLDCRIDHRSYERQGVEQIPTVHEGPTVRAMEAKGIRTDKGDLETRLNEYAGTANSLKSSLSEKEQRIKKLDRLVQLTDFHRQGKPVYDKLNEIKWKKKQEEYAAQHENALRLFYMARRELKPYLTDGNKVPLKEWQGEKAKLEQKYSSENRKLSALHQDLKSVRQIHYAIETICHEQERTEQAKNHKHEFEI